LFAKIEQRDAHDQLAWQFPEADQSEVCRSSQIDLKLGLS
jgi:hypothetical protein